MEGKIFGLPLVLIVLVVLILAPLVALDVRMMQSLNALQGAKATTVVCPTSTSVVPSVSPTPTKTLFKAASQSGQVR